MIEVNSSPAFDFSSDVTERLVKAASEDYVKVVVDYNLASKKKQKKIDTGEFTCIYKSKSMVQNAKEAMGINIKVEGTGIDPKVMKKMKKNGY